MQPNIQALMQDKKMLGMIVGGLVVLVIVVVVAFSMLGGGEKSEASKPLEKEQMTLATVPSLGQALEIQAQLAKHGIRLKQEEADGGKTRLVFMKEATQEDRDIAILTLVESGLMDRNVGLEIFEKGDLTASREEKRIKLIRAQQGELARLIRRIDPIKDASVNIAIPEQTLFRSEKKAMSASVQVTLDPGIRLTRDKVRAIINLVVGSVPDIDDKHVSLSDTNGNTYNSVLDGGAEVNDKLAEQDEYMRQKVSAQLDRLVGAGHYVVTVSTHLREAPQEIMVQQYDPSGAVVSSKQAFNENLTTGGGGPGASGPATSFLPGALGALPLPGSVPGKDYDRAGTEVTYNNSKRQWIETRPVGMIEDISIAVTIDRHHFPDMTPADLQVLLANAASPTVKPERVTIARSDLNRSEPLLNSAGAEEQGGVPWWIWAAGALGVVFFFFLIVSALGRGKNNNDEEMEQTMRELQELRNLASQHQAQLQATQHQTQMLLEAQQKQLQSQQQAAAAPKTEAPKQIPQNSALQQTLEELKEVVSRDDLEDDNLDLQIKSWIESS